MGMPSINISFTERAMTTIKRGERGVIALILKGEVPKTNPLIVTDITDIPNIIEADAREQIVLALKGYVKAPRKVIAYFLSKEEKDYTTALTFFKKTKFDIMAIPTVETDEKTAEMASWVKSLANNNKSVLIVLPNTQADDEHVINYATKGVVVGDKTYTAEQYCSRIAGIIAGTPLTMSSTFAPLMEVSDCSETEDKDGAIDSGELILYHDGEKVKIARAVNSLITTSDVKNEQFKKIKIVSAMNMIEDDLRTVAEDSYLGKYSNSYDNKCLLMSAIATYFNELKKAGVISEAKVEIDIATQKNYLKGKGINLDGADNEAIKRHNTGDKVFLKASVSILDAIEQIELPINI